MKVTVRALGQEEKTIEVEEGSTIQLILDNAEIEVPENGTVTVGGKITADMETVVKNDDIIVVTPKNSNG